jgi:hypothetical protein
MGVGGQRHAPAALPPGMTRCPLYRRLGRPQARSGRVRKISPTTGFDPRTVQLVASRYTDWAIAAPPHSGYWPISLLVHCPNFTVSVIDLKNQTAEETVTPLPQQVFTSSLNHIVQFACNPLKAETNPHYATIHTAPHREHSLNPLGRPTGE